MLCIIKSVVILSDSLLLAVCWALPQLIQVIDLWALFVVLVPFGEFSCKYQTNNMTCCVINCTDRLSKMSVLHPHSPSLPIFGLAGSYSMSGTAKMESARVTTLSLTMALRGPLGDVTKTTSMFYTVSD